ncbi:hypothetical protein DH09_11275 [Bacillaceae bacterium JMAK1]|nr:hypothetical protein DH09_11275 [Bacillaceae bacterium JMAK1]
MVYLTPKLGVIMLDTSFERIVGDIGNSKTFPFPVIYETVSGAFVSRVVDQFDNQLIQPFIDAAKCLESKGATVITTSCGFLALVQKEIEAAVNVPFLSSSLIQIPFVERMINGEVGVITARVASLTEAHFYGVSANVPSAIVGLEHYPSFRGAILEQSIPLNVAAIQEEVVQATQELLATYPHIKAIVLECTNLPPYREAIKEVSRLPVFDHRGLCLYVMSSSRTRDM